MMKFDDEIMKVKVFLSFQGNICFLTPRVFCASWDFLVVTNKINIHCSQNPTIPGQVKQVVDLSAVAAPLCSPDPQVPPFLRLALTYALAAHLLVALQCFITTF